MNQSRITLTDDVRNLYHQVIGAILTILQHGFKEFKKDGDKYRAPSGYDLTLEVKTVETKKGDFGGDEKEDYDVKEYRIVDHNHQEKTFNYHGLLTSQTDEKGNKTSFDYNEITSWSRLHLLQAWFIISPIYRWLYWCDSNPQWLNFDL